MLNEANNVTSFVEGNICQCGEGGPLVYQDMCYLHTYDGIKQQARGILELLLVVWSLIYLGIAAKEATFNERKIYLQTMGLCPSRVMFLLGICLWTYCNNIKVAILA